MNFLIEIFQLKKQKIHCLFSHFEWNNFKIWTKTSVVSVKRIRQICFFRSQRNILGEKLFRKSSWINKVCLTLIENSTGFELSFFVKVLISVFCLFSETLCQNHSFGIFKIKFMNFLGSSVKNYEFWAINFPNLLAKNAAKLSKLQNT